MCQEKATQPPGGASNTPWLLDVFVIVQQGGMKSLEKGSCWRKPCTGEPHPHGNDTQVAIVFFLWAGGKE